MNREFFDPKYAPEESEAEWSECNSDFTPIYKKRVSSPRAKPPKPAAAPPQPAAPPVKTPQSESLSEEVSDNASEDLSAFAPIEEEVDLPDLPTASRIAPRLSLSPPFASFSSEDGSASDISSDAPQTPRRRPAPLNPLWPELSAPTKNLSPTKKRRSGGQGDTGLQVYQYTVARTGRTFITKYRKLSQ